MKLHKTKSLHVSNIITPGIMRKRKYNIKENKVRKLDLSAKLKARENKPK